MWFYRNAVSFHIIFIVTHGKIFSHLGHTGPLTVNKMALLSMYRRRWRHIHAFIGRNMIAVRVQRFAAGANIICLTYATDWRVVIGPVIHGESKSQAHPHTAVLTWVCHAVLTQSWPHLAQCCCWCKETCHHTSHCGLGPLPQLTQKIQKEIINCLYIARDFW